MTSMKLPLLGVVEGAATWCTPGMATDHHKEAHMPANGKVQRVVVLQTQMAEST